jgi:putative hydrolase of the HAD superfamily
MIKTVIFDLGGVIVPLDFAAGYKQLEGRCPYTAEEIPARLRSTDVVVRFESGQLAPEAFHRELTALLRLDADFDEFKQLWCAIFPPHALFPHEWVEQIRRQKRVLLLSNTNAIHFDLIRQRYPHLNHFDHYVLSHEVGAMKPSAAIYREAIARAGCEPGECFFTDDALAYVEGARRSGLDAEQFLGAGKLRRDLAARGIFVDA